MKEPPVPAEWKAHSRQSRSERYEEEEEEEEEEGEDEEEAFFCHQSNHDSSDFHPVAQSLYRLRHHGFKVKII